jgi:hypothetical protein
MQYGAEVIMMEILMAGQKQGKILSTVPFEEVDFTEELNGGYILSYIFY